MNVMLASVGDNWRNSQLRDGKAVDNTRQSIYG